MLLIGLAGGTERSREVVAQHVIQEGGQQLVAYSVGADFSGDNRMARSQMLSLALERAPAGREAVAGMVITHVLSVAEADVIRRKGGFIWHLAVPVSTKVPISSRDILVTPVRGGYHHYLDPIEALSEVLLRVNRRSL